MSVDTRKLTATVLAVVLASLAFVTFEMQSSLSSLNSEVDRLGSKLTEASNFVAADTGIPSSVPSSGSAQQYLSALPTSNASSEQTIEVTLPALSRKLVDHFFQIETTTRSFFARDETGRLIPEKRNRKNYYQVGENVYNFPRSFNTNKTALIVMDPWEDSGASFLNDSYEPVIKRKLIPLINKSINLGIPVIVLTNSPLESADYGNKVAPEIESLAKQGKLQIVYHQSTDSKRFSEWLRGMGIDTLIYSGFASNMCVIGRDLGMIPMQIKGFRLFFVPEASAAVEFKDSWENGALHEATTLLISQWVGELIKLNDFLSVAENPQNHITNSAQTLRGGTGVISLSIDSASGETDFKALPNFVGDHIEDGKKDGVVFNIRNLSEGEQRITVDVQAQAIAGFAPSQLCLGDDCIEVESSRNTYEFLLKGSTQLKLVSEADVAYFVLRSISWKLN